MTVRRPTDRPSAPQAYQCKIIQSTGMATQMQPAFSRPTHFLREKPWGRRCFSKKKQQQSRVFFDVIFQDYTHVDNRERARASY